jgi:DNA-binding response OmpR family regulator
MLAEGSLCWRAVWNEISEEHPMAKRVLIADDEPNIVTSLEFLMEQAGYETRVAANGQEAIDLAQSLHPDLILLDIMFPMKSGYEVCQRLKSDPATRDIKIVIVSAKGRDVEVAKALELGADAFIGKPFSTRELVAKVKEMLGTP